MNIEFARPEDRESLKEVYHACFPGDSDSFWDFELDCRMQADNILVYREQGRIISTVQILSEQLVLNGNNYPAQYIYAAATLPEAQGRGLMGTMLHYAHDLARERGQRFSVLITQNDTLFDFYSRFGYRDCGKLGCISAIEGSGINGVLRSAVPEDIPAMLELYHDEQQGVLSVSRTAESFMQQYLVYEHNVLVYEHEGMITAYGIRIGSQMLEIVGPDKAALLTVSGVENGFAIPTAAMNTQRNGCVLSLDSDAEQLLAQQEYCVYLNLMWN